MARTAQKVESLISEDPALAEALTIVLDRTSEGSGEVTWADVKDDLSSGQWGRLIEQGVLVDGDDGFKLADPEGVKEGLGQGDEAASSTTSAPEGEPPEVNWTTYDKAAGVASLGLFAGYSIPVVRNGIGTTLDLFLGPLDALLPFYVVIMTLAVLTGLYSTLLQANLMDMEVMGAYQGRMKEIQERQKAAKERGDDEALEEIRQEQMEAMGDQLGMFKAQFKPMVWIMLLTIPVFLWMYWKILPAGAGTVIDPADISVVMPLIGELGEQGWTAGVLGPIQAWIVWYFLCSMAFTQVIRKALNIQTTPT